MCVPCGVRQEARTPSSGGSMTKGGEGRARVEGRGSVAEV